MIKKTKEIEEEVKIETPQGEIPKGRAEEDYFFPNERITIKASSMSGAKKKLEEWKKRI